MVHGLSSYQVSQGDANGRGVRARLVKKACYLYPLKVQLGASFGRANDASLRQFADLARDPPSTAAHRYSSACFAPLILWTAADSRFPLCDDLIL